MTEEAEIWLRTALKRLARETSVAGVKAALALAHWDGVDVPNKVLETIDNMDNQETPLTVCNGLSRVFGP